MVCQVMAVRGMAQVRRGSIGGERQVAAAFGPDGQSRSGRVGIGSVMFGAARNGAAV